jgi:hypothetical protein
MSQAAIGSRLDSASASIDLFGWVRNKSEQKDDVS